MEENTNYCVYRHTSPDGKVYIGITRTEPERRWRGGFGYASNLYFRSDIMQFGWANFTHDILFSGLSKKSAELKEAELIAQYNSRNPENGYNVDSGALRDRQDKQLAGIRENSKAMRKPVRCVETGVVYPGVRQAAHGIGVDGANISKAIRTGNRCHGYHWEYVTDNEEEHSA